MRRCQPFPNKFPWRGACDPELTGEISQTTDTSVQSVAPKVTAHYIWRNTHTQLWKCISRCFYSNSIDACPTNIPGHAWRLFMTFMQCFCTVCWEDYSWWCMIQVQGSRFQWCPVKARFFSKGAKKGFHGSWIWQLHPLSRKYHVLSQHNRQDFLESHVQRALTCDCRFETDGWGWKQRLIRHICSTPDEQHCLLLLRSWSSVLQTGSWWKSKQPWSGIKNSELSHGVFASCYLYFLTPMKPLSAYM